MPWEFIVFLALTIIPGVYIAIKRADTANVRQHVKSFALTTADPSRDIPVVFGTVDIDAPNIVWYGDMVVEPQYEEAEGKK